MCLSIVYDEDQNLLCENVMMVDQKEPGKLDFYNILGVRTTVFGSIEKINLMDNRITVKRSPAPQES
ncbi:MAG: CooT family nickel-binding protein [Eubacteriales bacterium]|nr:CooT family nickel-binding protein [Eubacteriales bacterium]